MKKFKFYKQLDQMDCGPTCLKMVAKYYGKSISLDYLRKESSISQQGVTLGGIAEAAESIGLKTYGAKIKFSQLLQAPLPCIVSWRQRHYIVVIDVSAKVVKVADPAFGIIEYSHAEFIDGWISGKTKNIESTGVVLLLEAGVNFENRTYKAKPKRNGLKTILPYFHQYKSEASFILLSLLLITILQLMLPFLTQAIVDVGITNQDIGFVNIILIAQLMLYVGIATTQIIRDWFLLHMTSRINIQMLSDFLIKLMSLPLSYTNSKNVGDILQRIQDHKRLQNFISSSSFSAVFSLITIIAFSIILSLYSMPVFLVFFSGSILFIIWTLIFLERRKKLDYRIFDLSSGNQSSIVQILYGLQEIKLNGSQRRRRWEWEAIQSRTYNASIASLKLQQLQINGGSFINEIKNIVTTFFAASAVIDGSITLGAMVSIQYIIGQLNVPVNNIVSFIQTSQDASLSLARINEIHNLEEESDRGDKNSVKHLPVRKDIHINNLNFRYGSKTSPLVIDDISTVIEENKTTAIVGFSGSGKTTLIRLLLKIVKPSMGSIAVGNADIGMIETDFWRSKVGTVMQDGYIFSDSILRNITESDSNSLIDREKLALAVKIANLEEVVSGFPLGYETRIGSAGVNLSGGQNQRIFIARAVYKNPDYFFLDEATSALDASNEKEIMEKLYSFFKGRTVIIVAHRLSTVVNADKVIVLNKGKIAEEGSHEELIAIKGIYYNLVKNQLELGS